MPRGQMTSLTKANKNSESLRTTVPSSVIKQFDLKEGDKLRWQFETDKKGNIVVRLEPVKVNKESIGKNGEGV
jgi:bifunctional DNA-binding transcriptional regulator/antitoxin component of YhaV-PrlF toxin-antitoxin module